MPSRFSVIQLPSSFDEETIQESHHLCPGAVSIRAEGGGAGAAGDLLLVCPLDSRCIVFSRL